MLAEVQNPWNPKLLWFWAPSMAAAAGWWYVVSQTLQGHLAFTTASLPNLLFFIIFGFFAFGLWLGGLTTSGFVASARWIRLVGALLAALPLLIFFPLTWLTLGVLVFTWLVLWWSLERFVSDAHSRLLVKPHLTAGWALPLMVTLLMLSVSTLYYQQLRGTSSTPEELGQHLSDQAVTVIERFLPNFIDGYQPDYTLSKLVETEIPPAHQLLDDIQFDQLTSSLDKQQALNDRLGGIEGFSSDITIDPNESRQQFESELEQELVQARAQVADNIRQALSDQFNQNIGDTQTIHSFLTELVNRQYDRYVKKYVSVVPWLLALGLFFILKILTGVFQFAATWIGWLLVWLYRHLRILHVVHDTAPAEKLEWGK